MNTLINRQKETNTIRGRKIYLNLSDADVERIAETTGRVGLTVSELLENFIGDLVDGTYTNGSDERMYANRWFSRCWFSFESIYGNGTFLRYLLNSSDHDIEDIVCYWGDIEDFEVNEDRENFQIYADSKLLLNEAFEEFIAQLKEGAEKPTLEDSMKEIMEWWLEKQQLANS